MRTPSRSISALPQESPEIRSDDPSEFESETSVRDGIAKLAYSLWKHRGCPSGSAEIDWLEAESVVQQAGGRKP